MEFTGDLMEDKVIGNELIIGKWVYHKPNLIPDDNGNIILISKLSFGPLEVFEWGIDSKGKPYEIYNWCENDFFENENYIKTITKAELKQQIDNSIQLAARNGLSDWIQLYKQANEMLNLNL